MKLGIITPNAPTSVGGVERFTHSLQEFVEAAGHEVVLLDRSQLPEKYQPPLTNKFALWSEIRRFQKLVADSPRCDAYLGNGCYALAAPPQSPTVMVFHGCYWGYFDSLRGLAPNWRLWLNRTWETWWEKRAARRSHYVAVSSAVADLLIEKYGLNEPIVIENGIELRQFQRYDQREARSRLGLPADKFLAIYTGRLELRKRVDILWEMARDFQQDEGLVLAVPKGTEVPADVNNTFAFDDLNMDEIAWALSAVDCFVLPSTFEGCSYSVIEAMASGLPPLISRTGHAATIAAAHPALAANVFTSPTGADLLAAMRKLKTNESLYAETSRQARGYADRNNSLEAMGSAYISLFERILSDAGATGVGGHSHLQSA